MCSISRSVGVLNAPFSSSRLRDDEAAQVRVGLVHADADVLVGAVGEVEADVAAVARGLLEEDVHAAHLRSGHRLLVAGLVAVERGVARQHGALERGDGLGDVVDGEFLGAEHLLEALDVAGDGPQALDARLVSGGGVLVGGHLDGVGDRPLGLLFERGGPAVPELRQCCRRD